MRIQADTRDELEHAIEEHAKNGMIVEDGTIHTCVNGYWCDMVEHPATAALVKRKLNNLYKINPDHKQTTGERTFEEQQNHIAKLERVNSELLARIERMKKYVAGA